MSEQIRINKYIANAGIASRRAADELIKSGRVKVNGNIVIEPGITINEKDVVKIDNKDIKAKAKKYIIFYKPAGYITTKSDPQKRKTIYDLLPQEVHNLKPAGRLDKDSSGLLIMTNDGDLIQKLTHPKGHVPKIYRVTVEGKINMQDVHDMQKGVEIEEGKTAYADVSVLEYSQGKTALEMVLYQGYNRQIRKMIKKLGHEVISLKRIAYANISLAGLEKGKYRYLSSKEVTNLYNYIKKIEKKRESESINNFV